MVRSNRRKRKDLLKKQMQDILCDNFNKSQRGKVVRPIKKKLR
jgi:hypothetical protein